jgi:hypothetical protein
MWAGRSIVAGPVGGGRVVRLPKLTLAPGERGSQPPGRRRRQTDGEDGTMPARGLQFVATAVDYPPYFHIHDATTGDTGTL